jgi:hypothetical protein
MACWAKEEKESRKGGVQMKKSLILSFLAGYLLTSLFSWGFRIPGKVIASQAPQITPPYPAYQTLKYVSSWEVRNEVWHDYRLDEEAQAAGYKIRSVSFSEDLLSIRVTK